MMNKVRGYKAFNNMADRYGNVYELNKDYHVQGKIKWQENGFHFCHNLEDIFRYYDGFDENTIVCMVEGYGNIQTYYDEYAEYFDMYVSSDIKILKVLSREEIINEVLSKNIFSIKRLIAGYKLTDEEIALIIKNTNYEVIQLYINYYQKSDKDTFVRKRK